MVSNIQSLLKSIQALRFIDYRYIGLRSTVLRERIWVGLNTSGSAGINKRNTVSIACVFRRCSEQ